MIAAQPNPHLERLLLGLAGGDALGSTSEFLPFDQVEGLLQQRCWDGWPFRQVGGGVMGWRSGEPTDDTAMAVQLVKSVAHIGGLDPDDLGSRWVGWMNSCPPDIGNTTRHALRAIERGSAWHEAGRDLYRKRPGLAANGSLMRNGIVPGLTEQLSDAWDLSFRHGIVTHYAPLPVLCCAAQTYLIYHLLRGHSPFGGDWVAAFSDAWRAWIEGLSMPWTGAWLDETWTDLDDAIAQFREADFDPDRFNPFEIDLTEIAGYCLTTLQIAVWATRWALRGSPAPMPSTIPDHVRNRACGPYMLAAVVLIGHDSDTYAATAGPMIAAATGEVPAEFTRGLEVNEDAELWNTIRSL